MFICPSLYHKPLAFILIICSMGFSGCTKEKNENRFYLSNDHSTGLIYLYDNVALARTSYKQPNLSENDYFDESFELVYAHFEASPAYVWQTGNTFDEVLLEQIRYINFSEEKEICFGVFNDLKEKSLKGFILSAKTMEILDIKEFEKKILSLLIIDKRLISANLFFRSLLKNGRVDLGKSALVQ